ncbi:O-antigen ligase family protein [Patescibacteria group bacterium]
MKIARYVFYLLLALAPLGTRYIMRTGEIAGVPVEPGTVSVFATQALVVVFVIAALLAVKGRVRLSMSVVTGAVLALFAGASVLWAVDTDYAAVTGGYVVLGSLLMMGVVAVKPEPGKAAAALTIGATAQAIFGLRQFFTQEVVGSTVLGVAPHTAADLGAFVVETPAGRWLRAYGTLPHPNMYGTYLAVGLLATIILFMIARSHRVRMLLTASIAVMGAGLLVSFSRSAFLALLVGSVVLLVFSDVRTLFARRFAAGLIIVMSAALVMGAIYPDVVTPRISGEGRLEEVSTGERLSQLDEAQMLFLAHPIVGVGMGQMPISLFFEQWDGRAGFYYQPVHIVPVLVVVELGLIGIFLWVLFIRGIIVRVWKQRLELRDSAFFVGFIALLTVSLVDHFVWSLWFGQVLFWIMVGMTLSALTSRENVLK